MIHSFQITEKIHETERSVVYRATRPVDGSRVVLKMLNSQYPTLRELARYQQEYDIISALSAPGVIQAYSIEKLGSTAAIVLEDFGGQSLDLLFERERPSPEHLVELALQAAAALGHMHQQGIIHKDINPSNLVWNSSSGQLKIIDFGIATRLATESPTLKGPGILEGTLLYISPEQTGRMNRRVDYRTDFYSLGATLYELMTGQPPFFRTDPLELVHCHIAAQPRPPIELRPGTSPMLSRIVMKLLSKTAEERYQSAQGLMADLDRCLAQLRAGDEAGSFPLGRDDVSDHFAIPQKLYGRSREVRVLLDAFERVARGRRECVLVTGYSGIGKSSLVRELYKPITRTSAFFVSGKFDLLQRATPYSAIATAAAGLVKELLTRSKDELRHWQEALVAALGPNGRLLIDVIPELELVIGPQPAVEELGATESQNRMLLTFGSFLRVFCKPAHPLVIFLDDLQWVDSATLRLLEPLMSGQDMSHFLLIGAYRDNEVDATHPLAAVIQGFVDQGVVIDSIHLSPLGVEDMEQLLADTLRGAAESVNPLAQLVLRRTGGNPFFISEFLKMLHEEGLLRFDPALPGWRQDLAGIEATPVTDSVVELLHPKLRRFPEETRTLLRLAACIGSSFDLDTIAIIADRSPAATARGLLVAIQEGYIYPASEPDLLIADDEEEPQLFVREYRFAHDRVQQAAYALIPPEQRAAIHLDIGRLLLARLGQGERDERLFELVDHLDQGRALLATLSGEHAVTPVKLAELNLAAGIRAREAAAHDAAARYLAVGIELVGHDWETHYDLVMTLHVEGATAELCRGDIERSQMLIDAALRQARSAVTKARLHQLTIAQHSNQARPEEAFRVGREALALLGQTLPQMHELDTAVADELARVRQLLSDQSLESLIDAPEMADDAHVAAVEILGNLALVAYLSDLRMLSFISVRTISLMLEHGQSAAGVMGYLVFSLTLRVQFQEYQRSYRIVEMAMRLADRFHSAAAKAKCKVVLFAMAMPWVRPLQDSHPIGVEALELNLQQGDLEYASYCLVQRQLLSFYSGVSLDRILAESSAGARFCAQNKSSVAANGLEGLRIVTAYLGGDQAHDDVVPLTEDAAFVARCRREGTLLSLAVYQVLKCQALYLARDYEGALHTACEARELVAYVASMFSEAVIVFYHALCLTMLYPQRSPAQQREDWQTLEAHQAKMATWVESCPENFRHMHLLVAAEMARIAGDPLLAMERYEQAIGAAEDGQRRQDAALANELAARFFRARGQMRYAMFHMRDAYHGYGLWGAKRKLAMLEAEDKELLVHPRKHGASPGDTNLSGTVSTSNTSEQLDLASVIKASQALSSEISLDKLLSRLIELVIVSAGAQDGYLILERRDRFTIEARGAVGEHEIDVLQSLPLDAAAGGRSLVSTAIVHYVLRTRETVVLHDAAHEGAFVTDPHVVATRARSILCMPLINRGKATGVVYMENRLSPEAFTPARVELLALLLAQMAISLDNAFLYSNLQRASQDLERLLFSIAHDLKEPLRAVQSFSELLVRRCGDQVDDKGHDYLARIIRAGRHLGELLDAIRIISEIRSGDSPRHEQVPGDSLVQEALQRLRPSIDHKRATVRVAGPLPLFAVDRRWASEAIYRIIDNALQFCGSDRAPEIDIGLYDGSEGIGLVIEDRGPGIPEAYAEQVFDLFRRAVGRDMPGIGAGLAIVRQIAVKHGGNAWLRPREGGGSEVYISFGR